MTIIIYPNMKPCMRHQNLDMLGSPRMYPTEKRATMRPMPLTTQAISTFNGSINTPTSKVFQVKRHSIMLPARTSGIIDREKRALSPMDATATWLLSLGLTLANNGVTANPIAGIIQQSHGAYGSNL